MPIRYTTIGVIVLAFVVAAVIVRLAHALIHRVLDALEIVGQDRPGIVHQISHALATHGVNVEELNTECASAAMTGETLFKAQAKLNIPELCNLAELRNELEKIAEDLIVDLTLKELPGEVPARGM